MAAKVGHEVYVYSECYIFFSRYNKNAVLFVQS